MVCESSGSLFFFFPISRLPLSNPTDSFSTFSVKFLQTAKHAVDSARSSKAPQIEPNRSSTLSKPSSLLNPSTSMNPSCLFSTCLKPTTILIPRELGLVSLDVSARSSRSLEDAFETDATASWFPLPFFRLFRQQIRRLPRLLSSHVSSSGVLGAHRSEGDVAQTGRARAGSGPSVGGA